MRVRKFNLQKIVLIEKYTKKSDIFIYCIKGVCESIKGFIIEFI